MRAALIEARRGLGLTSPNPAVGAVLVVDGNGESATRTERFTGKFRRSITLPTRVDANKVNATYKDGVLTVTLPKAEEAKPKQIQVNVS